MACSESGCRHPLATLLLVFLVVADVFSDVSTGVELILNDHPLW
jgi:hypothetical protein